MFQTTNQQIYDGYLPISTALVMLHIHRSMCQALAKPTPHAA